MWFLGLISVSVSFFSNKGDGLVVGGFNSLSENAATEFGDDTPGFASVENDRIRLKALFRNPMAEDSDDPNPAGFVPVRPNSEEYDCSS